VDETVTKKMHAIVDVIVMRIELKTVLPQVQQADLMATRICIPLTGTYVIMGLQYLRYLGQSPVPTWSLSPVLFCFLEMSCFYVVHIAPRTHQESKPLAKRFMNTSQ
jgi:hypothetical protein